MDTDSGGWTVIQRRVSDTVFYKTWQEYKDGFGDLNENFWLGNDNIHTLSGSGKYRQRVDLTDDKGESRYAEYTSFIVGDESTKYRLSVSDYSGTAGGSLSIHDGMMFSTIDSENDAHLSINCAALVHGAWWYNACVGSSLNSLYITQNSTSRESIRWNTWASAYLHFTKTEMKIKRNSPQFRNN